jgi:hypothetical protein
MVELLVAWSIYLLVFALISDGSPKRIIGHVIDLTTTLFPAHDCAVKSRILGNAIIDISLLEFCATATAQDAHF